MEHQRTTAGQWRRGSAPVMCTLWSVRSDIRETQPVGTASPRYPQEFRRRAVEMVRRGDRRQEDIARELGTSARQIRRWVRQTEADEAVRDALAAGRVPPEVLEVQRMRREIAQLKEANQALLEANRFFAARRRR